MDVSEDAAYYVGVDWAAEVHAVCVLDPRGKIVTSFPVAHSAEGIAALVARLARLGAAEEIPVGIERPNGTLVDLLLEAVAADESLRAVVVGDGPDRARLEGIANGRVEFTGAVSGERLAELYATCLGVYYAPIDEDFGMVPYEAFLSEKPVVTTTDAGGPLEIVADRRTGLVAEPTAASIGAALRALTPEDAARWGRAGKEIAERVTWDACIDRLLS